MDKRYKIKKENKELEKLLKFYAKKRKIGNFELSKIVKKHKKLIQEKKELNEILIQVIIDLKKLNYTYEFIGLLMGYKKPGAKNYIRTLLKI